ncbi:MAG: hypothetical protein V4489_04155 [Chlamydiota bacterium]
MTILMPQYSEEVCELIERIIKSFSTRMLERMKEKRSRIQNHSKDIVNVAFTVASQPLYQAMLGGYFLQVNLTSSKTLKMACEGYCLDERNSHSLSSLFYALTHLYYLHLCHVPITLYITSSKALELLENLQIKNDPIAEAVALLLKHLPEVTISPCLKGLYFEKMQTKLYRISSREINEIMSLDFKILSNNLLHG